MVQQISRPVPGHENEPVSCRHYWIIEAPTGPVSRGVCQICEEIRDFKNYIESAPWGDDSSSSQDSSEPIPVHAGGPEDAGDSEEIEI